VLGLCGSGFEFCGGQGVIFHGTAGAKTATKETNGTMKRSEHIYNNATIRYDL